MPSITFTASRQQSVTTPFGIHSDELASILGTELDVKYSKWEYALVEKGGAVTAISRGEALAVLTDSLARPTLVMTMSLTAIFIDA